MMKRYGLGWLDLEVSISSDLAFSAIKTINKEQEIKNERYMLDIYLKSLEIHTIKSIMAKDPKPFITFEEFKTPKSKSKKLTETDKHRMKAEAERIKKKFGG